MKYIERKIKLLNPKIDYVFKRIFGSVGNENITKNLLNTILLEKVNKVTLDKNLILEKDILSDKIGILDIKAELDDKIVADIEMQVLDRHNIEKRILYYWSKIYSKTIKTGENYNKLKKTIIVLFTDYELKSSIGIENYLTVWGIREKVCVKLM